MIVRITRAKVGHCQTPIYDTRLTAGVILCGVEGREGMKRCAEAAACLGDAEGLAAHARAARLRLKN